MQFSFLKTVVKLFINHYIFVAKKFFTKKIKSSFKFCNYLTIYIFVIQKGLFLSQINVNKYD